MLPWFARQLKPRAHIGTNYPAKARHQQSHESPGAKNATNLSVRNTHISSIDQPEWRSSRENIAAGLMTKPRLTKVLSLSRADPQQPLRYEIETQSCGLPFNFRKMHSYQRMSNGASPR
jgi:hypothetical protein